MPRMGFEPTISVLKRAKSFYALESSATVIDIIIIRLDV
jgi:hypothetical protein